MLLNTDETTQKTQDLFQPALLMEYSAHHLSKLPAPFS